MHQDIERAIDLIDHKIVELQRAKRTLIEAFGEKTTPIPPPGISKMTRKQTITKLLQEEGPLTRSEILQKSNIPRGTVATILNDKAAFRSKKGKWHLIEQKDQEEQKEKGLTGSQ